MSCPALYTEEVSAWVIISQMKENGSLFQCTEERFRLYQRLSKYGITSMVDVSLCVNLSRETPLRMLQSG